MNPLRAGIVVASIVCGSACSGGGPKDALFAFVESLYGRDPEAPLQHLTRATREKIGAAATVLRGLSGNIDRKPHELVAVTGLRLKRDKRSVEVLQQEVERAVLRVSLEGGGTEDVQLLREDGKWRIALGLKPTPQTSK